MLARLRSMRPLSDGHNIEYHIFENMVFMNMVDREREMRTLMKKFSSDSFELIIL